MHSKHPSLGCGAELHYGKTWVKCVGNKHAANRFSPRLHLCLSCCSQVLVAIFRYIYSPFVRVSRGCVPSNLSCSSRSLIVRHMSVVGAAADSRASDIGWVSVCDSRVVLSPGLRSEMTKPRDNSQVLGLVQRSSRMLSSHRQR
jgi:hypothetical protein